MSSGYEKGHGSGTHVRKAGYRMPGYGCIPELQAAKSPKAFALRHGLIQTYGLSSFRFLLAQPIVEFYQLSDKLSVQD